MRKESVEPSTSCSWHHLFHKVPLLLLVGAYRTRNHQKVPNSHRAIQKSKLLPPKSSLMIPGEVGKGKVKPNEVKLLVWTQGVSHQESRQASGLQVPHQFHETRLYRAGPDSRKTISHFRMTSHPFCPIPCPQSPRAFPPTCSPQPSSC